jgi:hypothetical protein
MAASDNSKPIRVRKITCECPCKIPEGKRMTPLEILEKCSSSDEIQEAIRCLENLRNSLAENSRQNHCHCIADAKETNAQLIPLCIYSILVLNKTITELKSTYYPSLFGVEY